MKTLNFKRINLLAVSFLVSLLAVSTTVQAATFEDNTLLRGRDGKIFVVRQGQREKIKDLAELKRNFRGQEIINVDDKTLAEIKIKNSSNRGPGANSGQGSVRSGSNRGAGGIKPNDSLIRSQDGKIFVTVQGERRHVSDLSELRREHAGQVIHNVDAAALNRFPRVLEDNPARTFDDNSLIRSRSNSIFVIEDNARRQIEDLNELRREHLGQAIHDVDDGLLREFELSGRDNEAGEDVRGNADENEVRGRRGDAADDFVNGVKLRGDGTEDDNLPRHSGLDDSVNGVKLRGDGTVDDNSTDSGRNRGSDDRSSSSGGSNSGSNSGSSGSDSGRGLSGSSDD